MFLSPTFIWTLLFLHCNNSAKGVYVRSFIQMSFRLFFWTGLITSWSLCESARNVIEYSSHGLNISECNCASMCSRACLVSQDFRGNLGLRGWAYLGQRWGFVGSVILTLSCVFLKLCLVISVSTALMHLNLESDKVCAYLAGNWQEVTLVFL